MQVRLKIYHNKRGDNLPSLLAFYKFMRKNSFNLAMRKSFTRNSNTTKLQKTARNIIVNEIYAKGDDEGRTDRAWRSIVAIGTTTRSDFQNSGMISVISDPKVAPSKVGRDAGMYSYVGFFENPNIGKGSFIPVRPELTPNRYRPFVSVMTEALTEEGTEMAHKSAKEIIQRRLPQVRTAK